MDMIFNSRTSSILLNGALRKVFIAGGESGRVTHSLLFFLC